MRTVLAVVTTIFTACLMLCQSPLAMAKTDAPAIATVDMSALLALHPAMASYDPHNRTFRQTKPRQQFQQDKFRLAKERGQNIQKYREQIKSVESQMRAEQLRFNQEKTQMKAEFDKSLTNQPQATIKAHLEAYKIKENQLSNRNTGRMRSFQLKIEQLRDLIEKENADMVSDRFTPPSETRQRFLAILAEIQQFTRLAAATRGINIVLDSSTSPFKTDIDDEPSSLPGEIDYSSVFAALPIAEITYKNDPASVQGHYNLKKDQAAMWYGYRSQILSPFKNDIANTSVVVGGIDLTKEVLTAILKNYRVDQNVQAMLLSIIQVSR
ncbi:MAG: hypothetical protein PHV05_10090 [Candidatus Riflebacteria bacterium]|nr:hypothetical protein [Candidatus Riflebacteria bacterium]